MVTMVDTWLGQLLEAIDRLDLRERTLVVLVSDHGTNFADNAERVTGKPAQYLYPGTMDLPLLIRHPRGLGADQTCDELVSTVDLPATLLAASGATMDGEVQGRSLLPLVEGGPGFPSREYLTCRYGNSLWYRDADTWCFGSVGSDGGGLFLEGPRAFDLESDPNCQTNIADRASERVQRAWERMVADAGGALRPYVRQGTTDALGRPIFGEEGSEA
jgi:arylsulfatase A-like enzyme